MQKSSSSLSRTSSLVFEVHDIRHASWKQVLRYGDRKQLCAAMFVAVVSLLTLVAPFAFYGGTGIMTPCRETTEPWRRYVYWLFMLAVVPTSVNSFVLITWAAGRYFRGIATHVTLVWANVILWSFFLMDTCSYAPAEVKLRGLHHILCIISQAFMMAILPTLVSHRIKVLEQNMFQGLNARRLRLMLRVTLGAMVAFLVFAVLITIVGNGVLGARTPGLTEMMSISTLVFLLMLLASYALVIRLLAQAFHHAKVASSEVQSAAIRLQSRGSNITSTEHSIVEAAMVARAARHQLIGTCIQVATSLTTVVLGAIQNNLMWPLTLEFIDVNLMSFIALLLDVLANALGSTVASGACSGALFGSHEVERLRTQGRRRRRSAMKKYERSQYEWQQKVEELAGRGFTLAALLDFYKQIPKYMPHYDSSIHTTNDIVRQAIIPASKERASSLAEVMMNGQAVRPKKMVTHNWGNIFRDLVAAIIADALGEDQYCKVAYLLDNDVPSLEAWLTRGDCLLASYWVCAFSVSQHDGICGANPFETRDSVTGRLHPVCTCGKPKAFNTSPPLLDGRSIGCEMNKFDDMMAYLAATDVTFSHIVAVDERFELFDRAWCIAELAMSYNMGMEQHVVIFSANAVSQHEDYLRHLKVEQMKATRPEDVIEILSKIEDKAAFNDQLQRLIFGELLGNFANLDAAQRMKRIGTMVRWQLEAYRSEGIWDLSFRLPPGLKRVDKEIDVVSV